MSNSALRAKFAYLNFADIQSRIEREELDAYDIVFAKDENCFAVISPDLEIKRAMGKVYTFESMGAAIVHLNTSLDTYEGQLIAILTDGKYEGYIVNKNEGSWIATPISSNSKGFDYDNLNNKPITNVEASSIFVLANQNTGYYKLIGMYRISDNDEDVKITSTPILFLVSHEEDKSSIKMITTDKIVDYVDDGETLTVSEYITSSDLKEKGFVNEAQVRSIVEDYEYLTKEEVEDVASEVAETKMDQSEATEREIEDLFVPES